MFERFSRSARQVVVLAQEQARDMHSTRIGTEHLLLGLLTESEGLGARVLRDAGLTLDGAREQVRAEMHRLSGPAQSQAVQEADARALEAIGIDLPTVRARLEDVFGKGAWERAQRPPRSRGLQLWRRRSEHRWSRHLSFSPRAKVVLELSLREALRLRHNRIGTEHLLLALLWEGQGLGACVLAARGLDAGELRARVLRALDEAA